MMPGQTEIAQAPPFADQLLAVLATPSTVPVDLDVDYFSRAQFPLETDGDAGASSVPLLPSDDYEWVREGAGEPRIPLQLCEFLAYKAALAYETPARIEENLMKCCDGIDSFKFFDTSGSGVTDTQAYAFRFENKAFVIFRGTEGKADWSFNLKDMLTDSLGERQSNRRLRLNPKFHELAQRISDPYPGRHLGFSLSWVAVKEDIKTWLNDIGPCRVVFAGHSLGGALALLAAFDFSRESFQNKVALDHQVAAVVTFGAPLVGNAEFARDYNKLLGSRTVRLESSGDMVPAIMRRWYYRWIYFLRKWAVDGLRPKQGSQFKAVGQGWTFDKEAPLSMSAILGGIRAVQRALDEAAKELAKKEEEAEKETQGHIPKERGEGSSAESSGSQLEGGDSGKTGSGSEAEGSSTKPATDGKGGAGQVGTYVIIAVLTVVVALVVWAYVRHKVFSHDIQQRYALYLSTLSYQQIRQKYGGDLVASNLALDEHLLIVRGNTNEEKTIADAPFFTEVMSLPVKLEQRTDQEFMDFLNDNKTFV